MKHECDMIQDLMLMCIDGTASDRSRAAVEEHVAECQPCAGVYEEMQQQLDLLAKAAPCQSFDDTVLKLRRVRRRRFLMGVAAVVMAGVLILTLGARTFTYLSTQKRVAVTAQDVHISLSRRDNGDVIINRVQDEPWMLYNQYVIPDDAGVMALEFYRFWLPESLPESEWATSYRFELLEWVEGEGLYYLTYPAGLRGLGALTAPADGPERTLITELRFGEEVIYRHGDALPLVSDGLEEYMQLYEQLYGPRSPVHLVVWKDGERVTPEDQLRERRELLAPAIPEWQ